MKNKYQVVPQAATAKKPAKAEVSDAEFRRRLKNISNGERSALPSFAPKTRVEVYVPIRYEPAYQDTVTWLIEELTELQPLHRQRECWRLLSLTKQ